MAATLLRLEKPEMKLLMAKRNFNIFSLDNQHIKIPEKKLKIQQVDQLPA